MQGCEMATLSSSTLHLFWDLFGALARGRVAIYMDAGTYPIARWGVERAAAHFLGDVDHLVQRRRDKSRKLGRPG